MRIRIIKPGLLSTVQDLGRWLSLSQAVPVSGVMDTLSARVANIALDNDDNAAVIEFTYANAEFITETDLLIAYAGDGAVLSINMGAIPSDRPVFIPAGTSVKLNNNKVGSRTYLAVAGGWDVPEVLGSRSTFITAGIGGMQGRALRTGDVLSSVKTITETTQKMWETLQTNSPNYTDWGIARWLFLSGDKKTIRVVRANEADWFEGDSLSDFFTQPYTLALRSNRMGYHLEGALMQRAKQDELLSTAVTPGTIQVTGNGNMVLLMADCQTTGGYPRIAQVAAIDLPLCGQLKPGDTICFKEITRREADKLYLEQEKQLLMLTHTVKNRYL
ncbi:MAG: 5-oxoprolinase subunit C family protein [Mucilaginibacter sp.]